MKSYHTNQNVIIEVQHVIVVFSSHPKSYLTCIVPQFLKIRIEILNFSLPTQKLNFESENGLELRNRR